MTTVTASCSPVGCKEGNTRSADTAFGQPVHTQRCKDGTHLRPTQRYGSLQCIVQLEQRVILQPLEEQVGNRGRQKFELCVIPAYTAHGE